MSNSNANTPLATVSPEMLRKYGIFYPYAIEKTLAAINNNQRFVHYTNADTANKFFDNQQLWLRKSGCMNDFMEIEHGFNCLNNSYKRHKDRLISVLDGLFPGFIERFETLFNGWLPIFREDTYIACLSEHDPSEDTIGRLSMWRAYGGRAGVAFVLNGRPFLTPSAALNAYTSPVAYLDEVSFDAEMLKVISNIEVNAEFVRGLGDDVVRTYLFGAFRHAVLCTKHPGFREEREWRIIYSPKYEKSERIITEVESVGGVPQLVSKLPLKDVPEEGLVGAEIPDLIERLIIGPNQFPQVIKEALAKKLEKAGVSDAGSRIIVSDIPLRNPAMA